MLHPGRNPLSFQMGRTVANTRCRDGNRPSTDVTTLRALWQSAQILTDNGTQFINGTVKELLQMINLQHITVLAYSKEENSIVERMNKEVLRHLRALVYEHSKNKNIEELLPSVQRTINASRNEANQTSPAELLFGNSINLDRGIFLQHSVLSDMNVSLSSWASSMLKAQGQIMR